MSVYETIAALFDGPGRALYFGEAVTEAEHALQCARAAELAGAPDELVAAALLHDIGHLLHGEGEDAAERGLDAKHEELGAAWLSRHFGPAVAEPARLHVAAKRYLCAAEPAYFDALSPASRASLALQGGPFTPAEVAEFESGPHARAAVELRRHDDAAKVVGLDVPGLPHYRSLLERLGR